MAKAGIDKLRIIDVGPWKRLSVLERYMKAAQCKKVAEVAEFVHEFTIPAKIITCSPFSLRNSLAITVTVGVAARNYFPITVTAAVAPRN